MTKLAWQRLGRGWDARYRTGFVVVDYCKRSDWGFIFSVCGQSVRGFLTATEAKEAAEEYVRTDCPEEIQFWARSDPNEEPPF